MSMLHHRHAALVVILAAGAHACINLETGPVTVSRPLAHGVKQLSRQLKQLNACKDGRDTRNNDRSRAFVTVRGHPKPGLKPEDYAVTFEAEGRLDHYVYVCV